MADVMTRAMWTPLTPAQTKDLEQVFQEIAMQAEQWDREYKMQQVQARINAHKIVLR